MKKSFKISAIGTHGTGKSTSLYELAYYLKTDKNYFKNIPIIWNYLNELEREPSLKLINEVASECPFPINQGTNLTAQLWMFSQQLKQEIEYDGQFDFLLIDRSLYDYISYTKYTENKLNLPNNLSNGMINISKMIHYDLLILHEINENYLKEDGIRDIDTFFQKTIDSLLNSIIESVDKRFYKKLITKKELELCMIKKR